MTNLIIDQQTYEIEAILFDKDGTLLEFLELWGRFAERMTMQVIDQISSMGGELLGLDPSKLLGIEMDETGRLTGYDIQGPLSIGSMPEIEAILAWQLYRCGLTWNEAITRIREFQKQASVEMERERPAVPIHGLIDFLEQCEKLQLPLCVVTADYTQEAKKHLSWIHSDHYFREIIGSDQVTVGKPYPEMIHTACQRIGVSPAKVALIGDTNGDMQMGKAAGVAVTIGMSKNLAGSGRLYQADYMISTYNQLTLSVTRLSSDPRD
ncbi:HAD family hydrolase [Paenibacillus sp. GP183]|jgi:phosphoglycolate phosphatase|uniref:HAD family hydrolase n=1 Tax=Paenibacillus sp. GP183 TaxID=1882751 RepID=UPI000897C6DE|nr:HAD family hydrolase [Paenibacillus sp. GP183]SEC61174.1 phosphoglycolate phosphatase [Paenibacillus sp. GP183]